MTHEFVSDIAFTPSVKTEQEKRGSRAGYQRMAETKGWKSTVTRDLATFISKRNSFYLATSNADGKPYIQHRSRPKGFLKVLDEKRRAFADFDGNKRYVALGNLADNSRAFIFLMDYAQQRRIKIWSRARVIEDDPARLDSLTEADYPGRPERVIEFIIAT